MVKPGNRCISTLHPTCTCTSQEVHLWPSNLISDGDTGGFNKTHFPAHSVIIIVYL